MMVEGQGHPSVSTVFIAIGLLSECLVTGVDRFTVQSDALMRERAKESGAAQPGEISETFT